MQGQPAHSGRLYRYRPALDGLRALAVVPVLLYHAGVEFAQGGFLGVDLFFVISGYLITTLLLREASSDGEIDLASFWKRRARRLFPALFAVLAVVLLYGLVASGVEVSRMAGDVLATLGYSSNWWFIFRGESYFEQFGRPSMLRHTWSLAIEEQFYIVWPLLVAIAARATALRRGPWLGATILGAGASALWMAQLFDPEIDPSRVYYGTDTRCQALLIGSALAFYLVGVGDPEEGRSSESHRHGAVGFLGAAACVFFFGWATDQAEWMYRGGYLLMALASAGAIAGAVAGSPGTLYVRLLSWSPLLWIGARSYGLYLWHWPIFVFLDAERLSFPVSPQQLLAIRLVTTFFVSALSYRYIESPIRKRALSPRGEVVGLVASLAVFAAAIPIVTIALVPPLPGGGLERLEQIQAGKADLDERPEIFHAAPSRNSDPDAIRILVAGDSVGASLGLHAPTETRGGTPITVRASTLLGCGITSGKILRKGGRTPNQKVCETWPIAWEKRTVEFEPDVTVVLLGAWEVYDRKLRGRDLKLGTRFHKANLVTQLELAIEALRWRDRPIFLLTMPCYKVVNSELFDAWKDRADPRRRKIINDIFRSLAKRHPGKFELLDLEGEVCPSGRWQETLDGVVLQYDGVHYTEQGAQRVWKWLLPSLEAAVEVSKDSPGEEHSLRRDDSS